MKKVIELTEKEHKALVLMLSEVADHPDAMQAMFPNGRDRQAGYRAVHKVNYQAFDVHRGQNVIF